MCSTIYCVSDFLRQLNRNAAETGLDPVRLRRFAAGFGLLKCYADNNTYNINSFRLLYTYYIYAIIRYRSLHRFIRLCGMCNRTVCRATFFPSLSARLIQNYVYMLLCERVEAKS